MEPIALTALVIWAVLRYGVTDVVAAARGTESPRLRERRERHREAKERRAGGGGPTVAEALGERLARRISEGATPKRPGPARQALSGWWADCWDDATDRRRRRRHRRACGDLPRQRARRAARRLWTGRDAVPAPAGHGRTRTADPEDIVDAEIVEDDPPAWPPAPDTTDDPPGPPARQPEPDTDLPGPTATPDDEPPLASVHPIRRDIPTMTTTESATTGETLDPQAGLAFAESGAEMLTDFAAQIELSVTTLTSRGVGGRVVELLAAMQEQVTLAAGAATEAKTYFEQQIAAQDTVLSTDGLADTVADTYLAAR